MVKRSKVLILFFSFLCLGITSVSSQDVARHILEDRNRADISFSYIHNFIIVKVKMFGGLSLNFIVDTGAEHTILFKREIADLFNTEYDRRIPIVGSDLSKELYALIARNIRMEIEGLPPLTQDILVLEENFVDLDRMTGMRIDGIIGGSFFKQTVLRIDYRRNRLTLFNPGKFHAPGSDYYRIPLEIRSNKPYMAAEGILLDNTSVDLILLVDTGAGLPLLLHNNSHPNLKLPSEHILGQLGVGLGGFVVGYVGRIKELHINDLVFNQVLTSFQDLEDNIVSDEARFRNGLLGNQLLSRFIVYLNYIDEEIYLRPLRKWKRKFNIDKSGLIIYATGIDLDDYVIQGVIPGSPADEAGLEPGDRIRRFQGWPARYYSLDQFYRILQKKEGKKIKIVIERDEVRMKKIFYLENLI